MKHFQIPTSKFEIPNAIYPLAIASLVSIGLLLLRIAYTGRVTLLFLFWNLFLAWIPLLLAILAWRARHRPGLALTLAFLWLLFLPNAPYLVTDLIHLKPGAAPMWYDLGMFFSFAFVGLALGLRSLQIMQGLVSGRFGFAAGWSFALAAAALSGLGIYIGRFLRWNSWELFLRPAGLAADLLAVLSMPGSLAKLLVVVSLFGALMVVGLLVIPPGEAYKQGWAGDRTRTRVDRSRLG